jgi:hypothetical protein
MPIVIEAVPLEKYIAWLSSQISPHKNELISVTAINSYKKLSVKATRVDTGESILYPTKAEAARSLGLTTKAVECRCKNGKPFEIKGVPLLLSYGSNFPTTLSTEQREIIVGCSLGDLHI